MKYLDEIADLIKEVKVSGKVTNCLRNLQDIFHSSNSKLELIFQLRVLDHVSDTLTAELTKYESKSLPLAPYVLEATARISSTSEGLLLPTDLKQHVPVEGRTKRWIQKAWYKKGYSELVGALEATQKKLEIFSHDHPESNFL